MSWGSMFLEPYLMIIGGLIKFSLIDYPQKMSAVIFTQGCNFRCPYCHNPELVLPEKYNQPILEEDVIEFLKKRRTQLEGVVITGGEPTIQKGLPGFLRRIRNLGYLIKLDTNGSNPDLIRELIDKGLVNYIAMDVKAPLEKYHMLTKADDSNKWIEESIDAIITSGIDHEFRTTLVDSLLTQEDITQIKDLVKGTKNYRLQDFISRDDLVDSSFIKEEIHT